MIAAKCKRCEYNLEDAKCNALKHVENKFKELKEFLKGV